MICIHIFSQMLFVDAGLNNGMPQDYEKTLPTPILLIALLFIHDKASSLGCCRAFIAVFVFAPILS